MVAADSRRQRDGRFLEILGHYNPLTQPYELVVHKDKVEIWISKGAQPSEQVASLLRSLGIAMHRATPAEAGDRTRPRLPSRRQRRSRRPKRRPKRTTARKISGRKIAKKAARKTAKKRRRRPSLGGAAGDSVRGAGVALRRLAGRAGVHA